MKGRKERGADLEALKKALQEREAAARKEGRPAVPAPSAGRRGPARLTPPPTRVPPVTPPEPPVSFEEEMSRMGVGHAPSGPERVIVRPEAPGPQRPPPLPGEDAALPENLDDEALWALTTRGVRAQRGVVARQAHGGRSEALPTLDLHGFTEADARHELRRFVALHRGAEPRWVRVITGRANHGLGLIRRATVAWLQGNGQIATFRPAPQDEGGAGVLLVQLRRAAR